MSDTLNITFLGLSITSSRGNGHATTYRALTHALTQRGHRLTFLERDAPRFADNRDLPNPSSCSLGLYQSLDQLRDDHTQIVREADAVIVGSFVPDGVEVGQWAIDTAAGLTAFYDIDTHLTLRKLEQQDHEYLHPDLIPQYDLYLTPTHSPALDRLVQHYHAPMARVLAEHAAETRAAQLERHLHDAAAHRLSRTTPPPQKKPPCPIAPEHGSNASSDEKHTKGLP